jgi:hypothetical protein
MTGDYYLKYFKRNFQKGINDDTLFLNAEGRLEKE